MELATTSEDVARSLYRAGAGYRGSTELEGEETLEEGGGEALEEGSSSLLSTIGETAGSALSSIGEAIAPVGLAVGVGMGLYDAYEEHKSYKSDLANEQKVQGELNNMAFNEPSFSLGSRALPSFDTSQFRSGAMMNF